MYRLIILILALTVANMPFATSDAQTKKKTTTTAQEEARTQSLHCG